jgi:hypothetical protein
MVPRNITIRVYEEGTHIASGLASFDHILWQNLRCLMENAWFSRLWVVQEAVLSRLEPIIVLGNSYYTWD